MSRIVVIDPVPRWRRMLSIWRQRALPRRCPDCAGWSRGTVEAITRVRFDQCPTCINRYLS